MRRATAAMAFFFVSVVSLCAQFEPSRVDLPALRQIVELTMDDAGRLRFVARSGNDVLLSQTFDYAPYAGVMLMSEVPGHELVALRTNVDILLYDPSATAMSPPLPWPGERELADASDYQVNGLAISTDGTRLRVGHLHEMGSIFFFYDIGEPLAPRFLEQSEPLTWSEISVNGPPGLAEYRFVSTLSADDFDPSARPAKQPLRPRSIVGALPALSRLVDAALPVAVVFPIGWSPDGRLAFAQISIAEDPAYVLSRVPVLRYAVVWNVQNMVTDEIDAEARLPADVDYDAQRFAGLFDDPAMVERGNRAIERAAGGVDPDQRIPVVPATASDDGVLLQTSRGALHLTIDSTRAGERLSGYEIRATRDDGRSKVISRWREDPGPHQGGYGIERITVVGALASPYEDRIAVIVARTRLTESYLRVVDLVLVGCHLTAGYR